MFLVNQEGFVCHCADEIHWTCETFILARSYSNVVR